MKDLILLFTYLYCVRVMFHSPNPVIFGIIILISALFIIKYLQLKNSLNNYKNRTKKILKKILIKERKCFTETLIHDFKIPTLAQLRGIDLLKNETLGILTDEQKEMLSQVGISCKYVLEMISMLTNAYSFDNGNYNPVYEQFNLTDLLISCFEELNCEAREKNITFSYTSDTDTTIKADKNGIRKVIFNMLISIINYSNNGDEIVIKVDSEDDKLVLSAIGKNFAGINKPNKYSTVGHRIGLYLCKKILEHHKGQIYSPAESNSILFKIPRFTNIIPASAV